MNLPALRSLALFSLLLATVHAIADEVELIGAENEVERSSDGETWTAAEPGARIAYGQWVRTGEYSRATLRFPSGNVLRLGEFATLELTPAKELQAAPVLDLKGGAMYFFSRDPAAESDVRTATVNAAIRGTEFETRILDNGATQIALFDGEVLLSNRAGSATMASDEVATIPEDQLPEIRPLVEASAFIQWYLNYPGVLDPGELDVSPSLEAVLTAYARGNLREAAIAARQSTTAAAGGDALLLAQLRLATGSVAAAEELLRGRDDSAATALRELIATVRGDALLPFVIETPISSSGWLARSYALQAQSDLPGARASAERATQLSPEFGYAWVRLAQLHFSFGDYAAMENALRRAEVTSPDNPVAQIIAGYHAAAANDLATARTKFDRALDLDPALADAWLGRGLVDFQAQNATAGQQRLQTAAALEPNRSLLRSYLGKAYAEQDYQPLSSESLTRVPEIFRKAEEELELAKKLDPADPTPWLYSALLKRSANRYNAAVADLLRSIELNDNRGLFRSRLLLDEDIAVRRSNLAEIYQRAGLDERAIAEAGKAVSADFTNFSAHNFLRGAYEDLLDPSGLSRRFNTAWANEWFLGNLLSPIGAGIVAQTISDQEYTALFEERGLDGSISASFDTRDRYDGAIFHAYRWEDFSYAFEASRVEWNEQFFNDSLEQTQFLLHLKYEPTAQDRLYSLIIYNHNRLGDLFIAPKADEPSSAVREFTVDDGVTTYTPASAGTDTDFYGRDPEFELERYQEPLVFLTYAREWNPANTTLVLYGWTDDREIVRDPLAPLIVVNLNNAGEPAGASGYQVSLEGDRDFILHTGELQHIFQHDDGELILGGRLQYGNVDRDASVRAARATGVPDTFVPIAIDEALGSQSVSEGFERQSVYLQYRYDFFGSLSVITALGYDRMRVPDGTLGLPVTDATRTEEQFSPKAGFIFTPWSQFTLRGYAGRSMAGFAIEDELRLEPSQLAGHVSTYSSLIPTQLTGTVAGATIDAAALAGDVHFDAKTFLTLEGFAGRSEGARTRAVVFESDTTNFFPREEGSVEVRDLEETFRYVEYSLGATLNHLLTDEISLGAGVQWQRAEIDQSQDKYDFLGANPYVDDNDSELYRSIVNARYQSRYGWFVHTEYQHWYQRNEGYEPELTNDAFPIINLELGYRLRKEHGVIAIGVYNLANQRYELSPLNYFNAPPQGRAFVFSARFGL